MLTELKQIFESVDKDILSEDVLQRIATIVGEKADSLANDRIELAVESALKTQYEKFKVVSEKALEAIDADHLAKAKHMVETLKETHTQQLTTVHEGYKKILTEDALRHRDSIIESIDEFVDMYIEKALPREQIAEAAKNQYSKKVIEEARKVLGVDESFMKANVKEAIIDGKKQMDRLVQENREFKKRQMIEESQKLIQSKTAHLPVEVAKFVRSRLENKPVGFIKENFDFVVDLYGRQQKNAKRTALLNENKQSNVDRNRVADEIVKESKTTSVINPMNPYEDDYLQGLQFRK